MESIPQPAAEAAQPSSRWAQYYALTKPRVVQLIVFCAFIGMVLAVPGAPTWQDWGRMLAACAGIW
ncbi:MAG: protoheme IX farnesyltransferase, partial [Comamonas sp.]